MNNQIPPRIVAKIAIDGLRHDIKHKTVASWSHNNVGKLCACSSITQDWEIEGWKNEGWFLTGSYTDRHGLRW